MRERRKISEIVDPDERPEYRVLEGRHKVRSVIQLEDPNNLLEVSDQAFTHWAKDVEELADKQAEEARAAK
jgi:hypothetical protein